MDKFLIEGIKFHGYHGVDDAEQKLGQKYEVSMAIQLDLSLAGKNDELTKTIDYTRVVDAVLEVGTKTKFKLIETLAEQIATVIRHQFPQIGGVSIKVKKLSPPIEAMVEFVGVEIHR